MPNVVALNMLTAGLRSDFANTYSAAKRQADIDLAPLMKVDVPSDKLTELFGYFLAAPYMRRWPRGSTIPTNAFGSVQYSVTNKDWGHRIPWHRNDRMDDQTGTLYEQAQAGGRSAGTLDVRVAHQILSAATDADLLDAIPTAPDGAALASATNGGGGDRFGVSGGNLVTGTGVATALAVRTDLWTMISRFRRFQDGQGQPLFIDADFAAGFTIYAGAANELVFREAFFQNPTAIGANTATSNAAVQNNILTAGLKINLQLSQRITDDDWWVVLNGSWVKPLFSLAREALTQEDASMATGESNALATGEEFSQWHQRRGYGINLPIGIGKINN